MAKTNKKCINPAQQSTPPEHFFFIYSQTFQKFIKPVSLLFSLFFPKFRSRLLHACITTQICFQAKKGVLHLTSLVTVPAWFQNMVL